MKRKRLIVTLLALGIFLFAAVTPRRAAADDTFTGPLLISAYILGGITVITLLAIMLADREDPDFMRLMPAQSEDAPANAGIRLGTACPHRGGNLPLACW